MLVFVVIVIFVAGHGETAAHQRDRDCQCCHLHAAHVSSTRHRRSQGLIAITPALEFDPWDRLAKTSDANENKIGCTAEHIFLNIKRTLNLSAATTWE
jgi:hypothetical protein